MGVPGDQSGHGVVRVGPFQFVGGRAQTPAVHLARVRHYAARERPATGDRPEPPGAGNGEAPAAPPARGGAGGVVDRADMVDADAQSGEHAGGPVQAVEAVGGVPAEDDGVRTHVGEATEEIAAAGDGGKGDVGREREGHASEAGEADDGLRGLAGGNAADGASGGDDGEGGGGAEGGGRGDGGSGGEEEEDGQRRGGGGGHWRKMGGSRLGLVFIGGDARRNTGHQTGRSK